MILHIKNMVCSRCNWVVRTELEKAGLLVGRVELGEAELLEEPTLEKLAELRGQLEAFGFELIGDKSMMLIEQIKTLIISIVNDPDLPGTKRLSDYLSQQLHKDYSGLSKLFSEFESITIEQYFILQKIEKVREWLAYGELNLTQIADKLGYSSVAHLSAQFKKVTGLTPSHFKNLRNPQRQAIDKL